MNAPVDISRIKPGDEVLVWAIVDDATPNKFGQIQVRLQKGALGLTGTRLDAAHLAGHTPKALCVGDVIWGLATKRNGKVIATHEDLAWVEFEDGKHEVVFPDQVERA